jgi:hypothetical protein
MAWYSRIPVAIKLESCVVSCFECLANDGKISVSLLRQALNVVDLRMRKDLIPRHSCLWKSLGENGNGHLCVIRGGLYRALFRITVGFPSGFALFLHYVVQLM